MLINLTSSLEVFSRRRLNNNNINDSELFVNSLIFIKNRKKSPFKFSKLKLTNSQIVEYFYQTNNRRRVRF